MVSWAAFGTFLVLKGSWLNSGTSTGYRGFEKRSLTEDFGGFSGGYTTEDSAGKINYTLPYLGNILVERYREGGHYYCCCCVTGRGPDLPRG